MPMKITDVISQIFIWGIGITKPRPGQERRAGVYITSLLFGSLALIALFFVFVMFRHSR